MQKRIKYLLIILTFILSLPLHLVACGNEPVEDEVVVTAVIEEVSEDTTVTRVISRTLAITPTPIDEEAEISEPVVLDLAFIRTDLPDVDPQLSISADGEDLIENLFIGLTRFNHDTNLVDPELAYEWIVAEDGRLWTFNLREDIFWVRPTGEMENGIEQIQLVRPVIAQDIVFAIQRICDANNDVPDAFLLFIIDGCEAVYHLDEPTAADMASIGIQAIDDSTLQVRLTKPSSYFLTMTSLPVFRPVPPELIVAAEEENEDWTELETFMSSGPFAATNNTFSKLVANPWWPIPRSGNVDIVNIRYLEEEEEALELWQDKQLDIIDATNLDSELFDERTNSRQKQLTNQVLYYLGFNFDSGVFREEIVRRAFAAAIDRDALVGELFGDTAVGMRHLVPPGVVGSYPVDLVGLGYSPDYARLQLAESGFRTCGAIPPFMFLVTTSDQSLRQAELISKMWQDELGCTEEQIVLDQAQFGTLLANTRPDAGARRPDIFELGWASYYPDAHNWLGDLIHCDESENRQNRPCSEVDDIIWRASQTTDLEERLQLYREAENMLFGDGGIMPVIPLYIRTNTVLVQGWVETFTPALFGGTPYDTFQINGDLKELEQSRQ